MRQAGEFTTAIQAAGLEGVQPANMPTPTEVYEANRELWEAVVWLLTYCEDMGLAGEKPDCDAMHVLMGYVLVLVREDLRAEHVGYCAMALIGGEQFFPKPEAIKRYALAGRLEIYNDRELQALREQAALPVPELTDEEKESRIEEARLTRVRLRETHKFFRDMYDENNIASPKMPPSDVVCLM